MTLSKTSYGLACVLSLLLAGCIDMGGVGGGDGPTDDWPAASAAIEDDVIDLVNARRVAGATCGGTVYAPVRRVAVDALLEESARLHSLDMTDRDYFSHTNPEGEGPGERVLAAGYEFASLGETIATGQTTAAAVVVDWMSSPAHCAILMTASYEDIGVGFHANRWTAVLASPL